MKKIILTAFICILTGLLLGGGLVYHYKPQPVIEKEIVRDTLVIEKEIPKNCFVYDTVWKYDTITRENVRYIRDTLQVFKDSTEDYSLEAKAVRFDSYKLSIYKVDTVYKPIEVIPERKKPAFKQSVIIGPYVGYGIGFQPDGTYRFSPEIGIGISYGFGVSW